jgi:hypothetical protein
MLKITFAGVDETIGVENLVKIQEKYPGVEFAVLLSERNSGNTPRYPSTNYLNHFQDCIQNYGVHLCGSITEKFNTWGDKFEHYHLCTQAKRIQINKKSLLEQQKGLKTVNSFYENCILVQPVSEFVDVLPGNVHLLLDNSGGKGIYGSFWPFPLENRVCGYAGGISDLNIKEVLHRLNDLKVDKDNCWVDIESGIRDSNNKIDIHKILQICEAVL